MTDHLPDARRESSPSFLKRRSFWEGRALVDAAHVAVYRLYCDSLGFWRRCATRACKRQRRCVGEPGGCLVRGLPFVPPSKRDEAQSTVIAGGPRCVSPASHMEWGLRRMDLRTLVTWRLGTPTP